MVLHLFPTIVRIGGDYMIDHGPAIIIAQHDFTVEEGERLPKGLSMHVILPAATTNGMFTVYTREVESLILDRAGYMNAEFTPRSIHQKMRKLKQMR